MQGSKHSHSSHSKELVNNMVSLKLHCVAIHLGTLHICTVQREPFSLGEKSAGRGTKNERMAGLKTVGM